MIVFVKAHEARMIIEGAPHISGVVHLAEAIAQEFVDRCELLESLLERAMPLLERSKRIISDQNPSVPHVIETSLENLRIEIDEALFKTEFFE